jgi:hypothetical protein
MALTLVGVTPGGFNVDSDCKVVVNSSSAAMITSDMTCSTRGERERKSGDRSHETGLSSESRDNKHELYSRSQVNGLSEKV